MYASPIQPSGGSASAMDLLQRMRIGTHAQLQQQPAQKQPEPQPQPQPTAQASQPSYGLLQPVSRPTSAPTQQPAAATVQLTAATANGVIIPPLRFPTAAAGPSSSPSPALSAAHPPRDSSLASPTSSARSSSVVLPQSNESATYFEAGGELALIMRVRLDTGVHALQVPYGVHAQSLATEFAAKHQLKPAQTHLLQTAISSHLDLLNQYQAAAAASRSETPTSSVYSDEDAESDHSNTSTPPPPPRPVTQTATATAEHAVLPSNDLERTPMRSRESSPAKRNLALDTTVTSQLSTSQTLTPSRMRPRTPTSIELARQTALGLTPKGAAMPSRRTHIAKPFNLTRPSSAVSSAWPMIQNATVSDRDVLKGLKGAIDTEELVRTLELNRIDATRRKLVAERANERVSPIEGDRTVHDPSFSATAVREASPSAPLTGVAIPPTPLQYTASFHAYRAETSSAAATSKLERARRHAESLQANPSTPFITPMSRALAAKRDERVQREGDYRSLSLKRQLRRQAKEAELDAKKRHAHFTVTGRTKEIVEETRRGRSSSASRSAALRLYEEDQARARARETARKQQQASYKTEREKDDEANCTFVPKLGAMAATIRNPTPIWLRPKISASKKESLEKEKARRQAEEEKACTYTPKLNPVSVEIALVRRAMEETDEPKSFASTLHSTSTSAFHTPMPRSSVPPSESERTGRLRSRSASVSSRAQQPASIGNTPAGSGALVGPRSRSTSPSMVGMAASERLHYEARLRRERAQQLRQAHEEASQPFEPIIEPLATASSARGRSRGRSPIAHLSEAETRRQLRALSFLARTQAQLSPARSFNGEGATDASSSQLLDPLTGQPTTIDWAAEKRRLEALHKMQLKEIHAQFLQRNQEFAARKQEYMERISSRFSNSEGTYEYDAKTRQYHFQPFFKPTLVSKQLPHKYDSQAVYTAPIHQVKAFVPPPGYEEKEQLTGPALYSGSAPQLVSKASSALLAKREQQRCDLIFMILDIHGTGTIDNSCESMIDEIPSETDRRIVRAIFHSMARGGRASAAPSRSTSRGHSRRSSISEDALAGGSRSTSPLKGLASRRQHSSSMSLQVPGSEQEPLSPVHTSSGFEYPTGSLTLPPVQWSLTLAEFSRKFLGAYKRLVQQEGPQATIGMASTRTSAAASAQASRLASGAITPSLHLQRRLDTERISSIEARRSRSVSPHIGSAISPPKHQRSITPHQSQPHHYLQAGEGTGGKGHSRKGSLILADLATHDLQQGVSPRSGRISPHSQTGSTTSGRWSTSMEDALFRSTTPHNLASADPTADFKPHLGARSEELARKRDRALLEAMAREGAGARALPPSKGTLKAAKA